MKQNRVRTRLRKARPLLLAAAGATALMMDGCNKMAFANLPALPPMDMAQPADGGDLGMPTDGAKKD